MSWLFSVAAALFIVLLFLLWQKWVAPWKEIEEMIGRISRGEKPPTFVIGRADGPRRVGLALEELFNRQAQLDQRITQQVSGADTVFAALQDGLLLVDDRRRLTFVNRTFQKLFEAGSDSLGRPILEVIRDPDLDRLVAQTLQSGEAQRGELTIAGSGPSSARRMQLSAVAVRSNAGLTTGAIVLFHDVTQLKQADEIRRDFVANVSHELRTPLSILRGYIETLLEGPDTSPDELRRILEVMNRHSNRLGLLVDDLLTLAQLESTSPGLQMTDVRLTELFAAIVRDWGRRFAEKRIRVDVGVAPDVPVLRADETRLQEILYNLLDNALKYTEPGGQIRLRAERRDGQVVLSVSDTGIGIPEGDLPRIFERFYRADKARSRELGGTGLGLSIVKHIAQMHGGSVEAESQRGRGTTIRVILPIDRPASV